jgi:hypothetical protein
MKISFIAILLLLIASCQKELQPLDESKSDDCEESELVTEPIKFNNPYPVRDSASEFILDNHSGNTICFNRSFHLPCGYCAYAKRFTFKLYKSPGVTVNRAILYIDNIKSKVIFPGTKDTLVFYLTDSIQLIPRVPDSVYHTCAIKIKGTGATGEWYEVKLIKAIFKKESGCRMKLTGLPQWGPIVTYE